MRLLACLIAASALSACTRYTQVRMADGTEYEMQPAFAKITEGSVAVRRRNDGAAQESRPIALQVEDVEDVRHPGLGRIIVGGVLTLAAAGGAAGATRVARTCDTTECFDGPLRAARSSWVATAFTSALTIHGFNLYLRSKHAFEGNIDLEELRGRYIRAGAGLLAGGGALVVVTSLISALREPDNGALSPDEQNEDSVQRLAFVLAPTAATWMIAGAIYLVRGLRLDPDDVPDLSLGVTANRRGAALSLQHTF